MGIVHGQKGLFMSIAIANYRDPYGYGATIRMNKDSSVWELIIFTNGKTVFRNNYTTRAGARKAMNRFRDIWERM